jgi:hypothetical protein
MMQQHDSLLLGMTGVFLATNILGATFTIRRLYHHRQEHLKSAVSRTPNGTARDSRGHRSRVSIPDAAVAFRRRRGDLRLADGVVSRAGAKPTNRSILSRKRNKLSYIIQAMAAAISYLTHMIAGFVK